jgi:sugar phosphate isomerase/epimerase
MRVATAAGPALLCYCANVHPGESLADVLASFRRFAGPVRRELGVDSMGIGLWLSRRALDEVRAQGLEPLRETLQAERLFVFTMNGFPYGNFQGEVVKREVYRPDMTTDARREYLYQCAEVLAALMPADVDEGTVSTLPLGHRDEVGGARLDAAGRQLVRLAADLARLCDRTGRRVRVCLEPEPGCIVETTPQAVQLFLQTLPRAADAEGVPEDVLRAHLGVSFDTCHQAVLFEEPRAAFDAFAATGIRVGKVQLSSALVVSDPSRPETREALRRFDEPRFLHQVRCQEPGGRAFGHDDLPAADQLPTDRPWRVHFHVPIHRELMGALSTSRPFLEESLQVISSHTPLPHLEVETYTWSVLPEGERPVDDAGLVRGLAAEMRFVLSRLGHAS